MRGAGILLHISSLPSKYGIGTMGQEAYDFIEFLKNAGQTYWQILPIGPTSYGDSPYQSFSAYAGNPLLIDIDLLINDGLLRQDMVDAIDFYSNGGNISYEKLFGKKYDLLKKAHQEFIVKNNFADYNEFVEKNSYWLDDYALFMALKYHYAQKCWMDWDDDIRLRKATALSRYSDMLSGFIDYWKFVQFIFFAQWGRMKKVAISAGIKIFGDIPIYVSMDSSDLWANPTLFQVDSRKIPIAVAGCPPDDFSPTGQLWGNPLYNWNNMEKDNYSWWVERIKYFADLYDVVRIDHFRGFDGYYAIPAASKTAETGEWLEGPGVRLFLAIKDKLGKVNLVAENLGFITESVNELLEATGYPGMNVMQFAFDGEKESVYMPQNYKSNSVTYLGTHDNDTCAGYISKLDKKTLEFLKEYLHLRRFEGYVWGMIRAAMASVSDVVIIQMQDYLLLNNKARMNIPSTVGGNWIWRMKKKDANAKLAKKIRDLTKLYFR